MGFLSVLVNRAKLAIKAIVLVAAIPFIALIYLDAKLVNMALPLYYRWDVEVDRLREDVYEYIM